MPVGASHGHFSIFSMCKMCVNSSGALEFPVKTRYYDKKRKEVPP